MSAPKLKLVGQNEASESPAQAGNPDYLAVPREQVLARETAVTDLFVALSSGKMVKVAHKGEKIDRSRIERLGEKNVKELFVTSNEFSGVIQDLLSNVRASAKKADGDKTVAQYFQVAETVLTELSQLPLTDEAIGHAVIVTQDIANQLQEVNDISKGLRMILSLGEDYSRHALGCVVVSNWLARAMGWSSPLLLQPLTLGAFLHDIGLKELPAELRNKARIDFSTEETAQYETHPTRGMMILKEFNAISSDVLQIVNEHHEMPNGQGYPSRLRGERMFPPAKVVSFANTIAHEMLDAIIIKRSFSIDSMIQRIDTVYRSTYGVEMQKAAKSIFKK